MSTFEEIESWFLDEVDSLRSQAQLVYEEQVLPHHGDEKLHGFRHALYGFMMNTMGLLDRLSCYDAGHQNTQTARMRDTLTTWFGVEADPAKMLIKMWRHTLMHTGTPIRMHSANKDMAYSWLIHWTEKELPREQHMKFHYGQLQNRVTVLNTALLLLIDDLKAAVEKLFEAARNDSAKKAVIEQIHADIEDVRFSL
ncbi:hypothetical protein BKA01_003359 [Pseudonocardia eucalypti]|nr:hypothetical protein [Pseudonocardia eucalypti]